MTLDERDATPVATVATMVTMICGYKGAGKSQLIANLKMALEIRVGTVVEEGGRDLFAEIEAAARGEEFDSLLVEVGPRTHPLELALQITQGDEENDPVAGVVLDAIVAVIDVSQLLTQLQVPRLSSRFEEGNDVDEDDPRSLAEVLMDQIESSDILILNKTDLVPAPQLSQIEALLIRLNPRARILFAENGRVPPDEILESGLYDFEEIEMGAGWLAQLSGEFDGLGESKGVTSFTYQMRRPFHPERLAELLEQPDFDGLIRVKGRIWVATRHLEMGLLSIAGESAAMAYGGAWFAATPASGWPTDPDARSEILEDWVLPFGDRCQQMAFIGIGIDVTRIRRAFDQCLLSDEEMKDGPDSWRSLADPLPDWYGQEDDDAVDEDDPEGQTQLS